MKASGRDIKDFWDNGWPRGFYNDDSELSVEDDDGVLALDLDEKYDLSKFGILVPESAQTTGGYPEKVVSFEQAFRKWYKGKTTATIIVSVPKQLEAEARRRIQKLGYSVT